MGDTRKSIGIQREKMVATFREVSGEAAPTPPVVIYGHERHSVPAQDLEDLRAAAPTPHSDSLDLEAVRAVLDGTTADTVDRGGILWLLSTCAALLSRLDTLTRERGAYPEVLADNEKLTVENESLYRRFDKLESENAALLSRLETRGRWYRDAIRLLANVESENARMAEVLNPAQLRNIATGLEKVADRGYRLSADQVSEYRTLAASLVALAARASRTQSPTATTEKK